MVVGTETPGGPVTGVCDGLTVVVGTTVSTGDDGVLVSVKVVVVVSVDCAATGACRDRGGEFDTDQATLATVRAVNVPKATQKGHRLTAMVQGYAWSRSRAWSRPIIGVMRRPVHPFGAVTACRLHGDPAGCHRPTGRTISLTAWRAPPQRHRPRRARRLAWPAPAGRNGGVGRDHLPLRFTHDVARRIFRERSSRRKLLLPASATRLPLAA
jgi:hypothetical protein